MIALAARESCDDLGAGQRPSPDAGSYAGTARLIRRGVVGAKDDSAVTNGYPIEAGVDNLGGIVKLRSGATQYTGRSALVATHIRTLPAPPASRC